MLVVRLLFVCLLLTQAPASPSGHWEGTIHIPDMDMQIEVDIAKNSKGEWAGMFAQPKQGLKGFPLSTVSVDGRSVRFVLKAGPEISTFAGMISDDGKSLSGDVTQSSFNVPFSLVRKGEARIAAAPKNPAIDKEVEGTWNASIEAGGRSQRIILKLANQSDGTAAGTIMSPDGSGVEIPVAISQKGANVTIDVEPAGISYVATLKGTELTGTWTQGTFSVPVTFRREAK